MQRKHTTSSEDCGAWSDYRYTPPAQPRTPNDQKPVRCTGAGPDSGKTLPPGSTCAPAPAAATKCPAGSRTPTVPAGQQCTAPDNAVVLGIVQKGLNARVSISNLSSLPATCTYTGTKVRGLGPHEVDRSVDVGPEGNVTIDDMLWPPPGTTYHATVLCAATYDGKKTQIGTKSKDVNG